LSRPNSVNQATGLITALFTCYGTFCCRGGQQARTLQVIKIPNYDCVYVQGGGDRNISVYLLLSVYPRDTLLRWALKMQVFVSGWTVSSELTSWRHAMRRISRLLRYFVPL
jgi:hypothetical protein